MQMLANKEFISKLISCDIVVWNGTVTEFGIIRYMISENDMLRMADEEEIRIYKAARRTQNGKTH